MGEKTAISWCDHTFNAWWGCVRVSEACQNCYAEAWAKRLGVGWGKNAERRFFGDSHWAEPRRWNEKARRAGVPSLVFCSSMADVFEDHPDLPPQRERLWDLVAATPWLTWQLLTKRPENIAAMVPGAWYVAGAWPVNVWVGTTVENQARADERLPLLLEVPAPVRFVSCEPLFGPLDLGLQVDHRGHQRDFITTDVYPQCLDCSTDDEIVDWTYPTERGVDWVIAGGESGPKAKPSHPDWFRSVRDQCGAAGVPFLFKQWGEWLGFGRDQFGASYECAAANGARHYEWNAGPDGEGVFTGAAVRLGKKAAGAELDGRTWGEIPARVTPLHLIELQGP